MNNIAEESLLLDFYGSLLSDRKQEVVRFYHEDNLSLSEIAEELGVSRNAVYDALKKAEAQLAEYERKLGLVQKYEESSRRTAEIRAACGKLLELIPAENTQAVRAAQEILALAGEPELE